jgi:outer membrane protein TolC
MLVAGVATLGGCAAVGPNYQLPEKAAENAPAAQRAFVSGGGAVGSEASPDHWWKLFDDPRLPQASQAAYAAADG